MVIAVGCVALSFTSSTTNPEHRGDSFTVDHNGATVVASEAEYDRVLARQTRPDLAIPLAFAAFSYVMLDDAETDARTTP